MPAWPLALTAVLIKLGEWHCVIVKVGDWVSENEFDKPLVSHESTPPPLDRDLFGG